MYKSIAQYYDLLGWGEFNDIAMARLKPLLIKHRCKSYLDLASGTGTLSFMVSRMGIDVVGLDRSKEMLSVANERLRHFTNKLKLKPKFVLGDMTKFNLKRQFDAVGCFFDAANHIVDPDGFANFIRLSAAHVKPGGFFIFDVNTPIGLNHWDAVLFSKKGEHALLMKGKYNRTKRLASITIHGYVRNSKGDVDRFKETFYERGYPHGDIMKLLKKTGFGEIIAMPQKSTDTLRSAGRVFYVAYKKAGSK